MELNIRYKLAEDILSDFFATFCELPAIYNPRVSKDTRDTFLIPFRTNELFTKRNGENIQSCYGVVMTPHRPTENNPQYEISLAFQPILALGARTCDLINGDETDEQILEKMESFAHSLQERYGLMITRKEKGQIELKFPDGYEKRITTY